MGTTAAAGTSVAGKMGMLAAGTTVPNGGDGLLRLDGYGHPPRGDVGLRRNGDVGLRRYDERVLRRPDVGDHVDSGLRHPGVRALDRFDVAHHRFGQRVLHPDGVVRQLSAPGGGVLIHEPELRLADELQFVAELDLAASLDLADERLRLAGPGADVLLRARDPHFVDWLIAPVGGVLIHEPELHLAAELLLVDELPHRLVELYRQPIVPTP